jgi:hypothetical protein
MIQEMEIVTAALMNNMTAAPTMMFTKSIQQEDHHQVQITDHMTMDLV